MPNHITTRLHAPVEVVNDLIVVPEPDAMAKPYVDFDKVVQQPPNMETGGCNGNHPEGVICWYEWNIENWGTKWNGYDTVLFEGGVQFDTAWSHPLPVIEALSRRHPGVEIDVQFADEDLGHNCGHYVMRNGEIIEGVNEDHMGQDAARDFAALLKYGVSYADLCSDQ